MKKLGLIAALVFSASMANAQAWTTPSVEQVASTAGRTTYQYEFTAVTDSVAIDVSELRWQNLEVLFDPSTGDASTDARVEIRFCPASTAWQYCRQTAPVTFNTIETAYAPLVGGSFTEPYVLVHVLATPTGGDTARIRIRGEGVEARNEITRGVVWASGSGPSAGINEAIALAGVGVTSSHGIIVKLPCTTPTTPLLITTQLVVGSESSTALQQQGITLSGCGHNYSGTSVDKSGTWIKYVGAAMAAGEGVLQISGNDHRVEGIAFDANNLADYGIHIEGSNAVPAIANGGAMTGVAIVGVRVAGIQFGDGVNDLQADLWNLQDLKINDNRSAGDIMDYCVRVSNTNALHIFIRNMECAGYATYGVEVTSGQVFIYDSVFLELESFQRNGALYAIHRGTTNVSHMVVHANWFEMDNGGCFESGGLAIQYAPFDFTDNNCLVGGGTSGTENTSTHFTYYGASPLILTGNIFAERSDRSSPPADRVIIGNFNESTLPLKAVVSGNQYGGVGGKPTFSLSVQHGVAVNSAWASVASSTAITNTTTEAVFSTCTDREFGDNTLGVGATWQMQAWGTMSTDVALGNVALRFRWGTAITDPLLCDLGPTIALAGGSVTDSWYAECTCTVRTIGATGTVTCGGHGEIPTGAVSGVNQSISDTQTGTTTIDTTVVKIPSVFLDWSTADVDNTALSEGCTSAGHRLL